MRIIILDGNENQAVAAARSLASAGHVVIVGADSPWSKAGWSRAASRSFIYPAPQRAVDAFVDCIAHEVSLEPGTLVLPMTERTTISLSARRQEIILAGGRLVLPAHENVMRACDKQQTTALAKSLGLAVPRTSLISNSMEAEDFARSGYYPIVMKPRSSEEISVDGRILATGAPRYARDAQEFIAAYLDMSRRCSAILVQEFTHGTGAGYFALMNTGKVRAEFAHRRIRDVRPTGSGSALRVSVELDPEIRQGSLRMLESLKWHGVAMVEFRKRTDGTPVFLEVNGRFWNSLALAIHAGVDFPRLVAEMVEHGDIEPRSSYRPGVRCRWLLGDLRHLVEVWRGCPKGYSAEFPGRFRTLMDFLTPVAGTFHDNFTWSDPLPAIGDCLDFVMRRIPAFFNRRITGFHALHAKSRFSLP